MVAGIAEEIRDQERIDKREEKTDAGTGTSENVKRYIAD